MGLGVALLVDVEKCPPDDVPQRALDSAEIDRVLEQLGCPFEGPRDDIDFPRMGAMGPNPASIGFTLRMLRCQGCAPRAMLEFGG